MFLHSERIFALFFALWLPATAVLAETAPSGLRPHARPNAPADAQPSAQVQADVRPETRPEARPEARPDTEAATDAATGADTQNTAADDSSDTEDTAESTNPVPEPVPDGTPLSTSKAGVVFATDDIVPPIPMALAMQAIERGDWEQAENLARREGPPAVILINYLRLREGLGSPREMLSFIHDHSDWPDLDRMLIKTELTLVDSGPQEVLAFFKNRPPQSGLGALIYAKALKVTGQTDKMDAMLIEAWRTLDLTTEEHDAFIKYHNPLLTPHHPARLDMALWRGLKDVKLMLPIVPEAYRIRAEKRLALQNKTESFDTILPRLSYGDKVSSGIAYEMFNHYIEADDRDKALEILVRQSTRKNGLGQPEKWAGWRRSFTREEMRSGDRQLAYKLAATHQLTEGSNFADLEWLAGYIALTYLDAPAVAYVHFENLKTAVQTPISLGRAHYWIGRALEASALPEDAQAAYQEGARYQSSFYGLLAAEKAGVPFDLWPDPAPAPQGKQPFENGDVFQASQVAYASGFPDIGYALIMSLADNLPEPQLRRLGQIIAEQHSPFLEVKFGKRVAQRGIVLPAFYYTMHPLADMDLPVSTEMALAIARRESEFNPTVKSHAGAEGLMQLMPGTASDVARDLGVAHSQQKVISDWSYNVRLGSTYLAQLASRFDGNVTMIAAGYNAGPGRPIQWMEAFGDPRKPGGPDIVDWIEHIPFRETRNYVMRVSESLPIYRARLGKPALPVPFSKELAGSSIKLAKAGGN